MELKKLWNPDEEVFFNEAYIWDAVTAIIMTNPEVYLILKIRSF